VKNSATAVEEQILTKAVNGTIGDISAATALKMGESEVIGATEGAMAGQSAGNIIENSPLQL
jgi:hypothetical protein